MIGTFNAAILIKTECVQSESSKAYFNLNWLIKGAYSKMVQNKLWENIKKKKETFLKEFWQPCPNTLN